MTRMSYSKQNFGFGLIETVIGAAIISIVLIGLAEVGRFAFRIVDGASFKIRAAFLTEEGTEAVRSLRDASWSTNISSLALDTDYYLSFSNGSWHIGLTHVPLVDSTFSRTVRFSAACRDGQDAITTCGSPPAPDTNIKKVSVSVGWRDRGHASTTTIDTYITNIHAN